MNDTIWGLPGPRSYIEDIAGKVTAGQHVLAVLPRYLYEDNSRADALLSELLRRIDSSRRVAGWGGADSVAEAFGQELVFADEAPVTVPDLLRHPAGAGQVLVCLLSDLDPAMQKDVPDFLRRLDAASRTVPVDQRCTLVLIATRKHLPHFAGGDNREVSLATSWYWNRVSRWDVSAHIAQHVTGMRTVLRDVRQETVVELARWDFDLAASLASSWSGDPQELLNYCSPAESPSAPLSPPESAPLRPPDTILQAWDDGLVECWHDRVRIAPTGRDLLERGGVARYVWLGQARVLLPWIEMHRHAVEAAVRATLGNAAFEAALAHYTRAPEHQQEPGFAPEIGVLNVVVQARLGRESRTLKTATRALWRARNELAHLRALGTEQLEELVRACEPL